MAGTLAPFKLVSATKLALAVVLRLDWQIFHSQQEICSTAKIILGKLERACYNCVRSITSVHCYDNGFSINNESIIGFTGSGNVIPQEKNPRKSRLVAPCRAPLRLGNPRQWSETNDEITPKPDQVAESGYSSIIAPDKGGVWLK